MKRSLTMCAVGALLMGVSIPAAALPLSTMLPSAEPRAAGTPEAQSFALSSVVAAPIASHDDYEITEIIPEPSYAVLGHYSGSYSGAFGGFTVWPAAGHVNDGWGYRDGGEMHSGIDIMAPRGSAIVAAAAGVVTEVSFSGGWGQYVKIDHGDGIASLYAHMIGGSAAVYPGQVVSAGEYLGAVGDTGYATANHLHFEVYVYGGRVDPMPWMP